MRSYISKIIPVITMLILTGCTAQKLSHEKVADLEYTIVNASAMPSELVELIADNESTKMNLTYTDQGLEYIVVGYGAQKTSGYSVEVLEVYETANAVVVDTNLLGPEPDEEIVEKATFPYVVILIEEADRPVIFD